MDLPGQPSFARSRGPKTMWLCDANLFSTPQEGRDRVRGHLKKPECSEVLEVGRRKGTQHGAERGVAQG